MDINFNGMCMPYRFLSVVVARCWILWEMNMLKYESREVWDVLRIEHFILTG
jgi:hypothetical protein